ncbi:MAG: hypothetical protein R2745_17405 [Vicinamibacterales bacterium]
MTRRTLTGVGLAVVMALVASGGTRPDAAEAWDAAAAARYLDARMDLWWAKAKPLKTGGGTTTCLSCHTAIPYALARPVLRMAMGVAEPTAHEARIQETLRLRVEHLGDEAPYYDHTEAKKTESAGVEAVTAAWILTRTDTLGRSALPSATTRRAMARLWAVQRPDGAWDWLDFGLEPYETADAAFHGATLAAMAAGSTPGRAASTDASGRAGIDRLRAYLHDRLPSQRRFNKVWALMASAGFSGIVTAPERDALVRDLESVQRADGGWSLADLGEWHWSKAAGPYAAPGATDGALLAASDAYATGLVVHALREVGRTSADAAVARGQSWLRAHQVAGQADDPAWAPWRSHSLNFDREHGGDKGEPWRRMFMSDMATAFAVLALR